MKTEIKEAIQNRNIQFLLDYNYKEINPSEVEEIYNLINDYILLEVELVNLTEDVLLNLLSFDKSMLKPVKGCYKVE